MQNRHPWRSRASAIALVARMAALLFLAPIGIAQAADSVIPRGEYLAQVGGCASCHTVPGGASFAGGLAMKLPIGTIFTPNITPDPDQGIGKWTDDDFVRAMHEGIGKDGRHFYPAFPYTSFSHMTRDDVLAIKAYLFSQKPVKSSPPDNKISFPFNQRWGMALWNVVFHDDHVFQPDASKSADWNRGAYLVNAVAHCGECHTPRALTQQMKTGSAMGGGEADGWDAYNITPDPVAGIGGWSDAELTAYLATGAAPGKGWATGPMGLEVADSTSYLTPDDMRGMVTYLRSLKPVAGDGQTARFAFAGASPVAQVPDEGGRIYDLYCANCHGSSGVPVVGLYPSMTHESTVGADPVRNLVMVMLQGVAMTVGDRNIRMPSFAQKFDDAQLAAVANHVVKNFGNPQAAPISAADVAKLRAQ